MAEEGNKNTNIIILNQDKMQEEMKGHLHKLVLTTANESITQRGIFTIGLSGGSLIKALSEVLKSNSADISWDKWQVFFCDERHVEFGSPDSTYGEYKKALFDHVPLPDANIHKCDPSVSLATAATDYINKLIKIFGAELPQFDLLLLGMGPDGHTCSLFPGHPGLTEDKLWIIPISDSPKPPPSRITFTYPLLNNARQVVFVSTGASKAESLKRCLKPDSIADTLPAGLVKPKLLCWIIDEAAYSMCK